MQPGDLVDLVALGEALFFGETFEGNGRRCGTCHPATNNFTIDPDFIATLPPEDPLFVAENVPALNSALNGGLVFENPALMRQFGLIVENLDGFDELETRYVMRGVQHVLGLASTIVPAPNLAQPFTHLVGWSGDGSQGTGSLREFATRAVRQHFPRTLGRVEGIDFRLPTARELNAIEAFLLSLGRTENMKLQSLKLLDAGAANGQNAFANQGVCSFCHGGAGSTGVFVGLGTGDFLANTGVEAFTQNHPDGTGEPRPPDGGFGTNPEGEFGSIQPNPDGSFGEGTFNAQSLIEAADTLPAFHSNLTAIPNTTLPDTIEGAVEFYTTPEFAAAAFPIQLTPKEIKDIGRFLRVLNALDNLRTMGEYADRAVEELTSMVPAIGRVNRLAALAGNECRDVLEVLGPVGLHPAAQVDVAMAAGHFRAARRGPDTARLAHLGSALALLQSARADMVQ